MNTRNYPAVYEAGDVLEEVQAVLFDEIEYGDRGVIATADYDRRAGEFILTTNGGQRWRLRAEPVE